MIDHQLAVAMFGEHDGAADGLSFCNGGTGFQVSQGILSSLRLELVCQIEEYAVVLGVNTAAQACLTHDVPGVQNLTVRGGLNASHRRA